ncbi:cadmium resistance transporter [Rhizobium lusitanum]|uniref:Cadmium resistance protein CadD (Predicted permease) n=1 Tax=Rhizobium lusitanum TaxID=293958 RepID=A0A7X0IVQ1_9HYPH|nr:cadmium resistance transporter [Rhizobium lusitanum]MBB6488081.1 cadmium resistance protein CadD (predicted permease) [Rhizobium lusitanum]
MDHLLGALGVAIVVFASTDVDDLFVLLGFFADPKFRVRQIIIGQYLGIAALFGFSVLASLLVFVVPAAYIGLLGLAPIYFGLKRLWEIWNGIDTDDNPEDHEKASAGHGNIVAVALVTIANGGDNISVYTPLFATRSAYEILAFGCVFAALTAVWLGVAHALVNHPKLGAPIRRHGYRVVPFVLIAIGVLILYEAGTVVFFWS